MTHTHTHTHTTFNERKSHFLDTWLHLTLHDEVKRSGNMSIRQTYIIFTINLNTDLFLLTLN